MVAIVSPLWTLMFLFKIQHPLPINQIILNENKITNWYKLWGREDQGAKTLHK